MGVNMGMSWQLDGMDDDALSDEEEEVEKKDTLISTKLAIIITNARSLCPKITSLIDCIDQLEARRR